jgi:tetratricopeptide (TPR) repeat protein
VTAALALALLTAAACRRETGGAAGTAGSSGPLGEAAALVEERRYDEAIARLGAGDDAETLYLLGRAWAGKAETAPVPTPLPGQPTPLKPEAERALDFLERAVAARPDHAGAHLAIAELLAPYALARIASGRRADAAAPGPDLSVDRVLGDFGDSLQADPAATAAAEGLVRFATSAGRLKEAEAGYEELVRRRREDPDLLVRYGDFLAGPARNPEAALARYAQALIWRPDDSSTRLKMADIHLAAAAERLARQEYFAAEARLRDARRLSVDPASAQAARLRELEGRIREIRGR